MYHPDSRLIAIHHYSPDSAPWEVASHHRHATRWGLCCIVHRWGWTLMPLIPFCIGLLRSVRDLQGEYKRTWGWLSIQYMILSRYIYIYIKSLGCMGRKARAGWHPVFRFVHFAKFIEFLILWSRQWEGMSLESSHVGWKIVFIATFNWWRHNVGTTHGSLMAGYGWHLGLHVSYPTSEELKSAQT